MPRLPALAGALALAVPLALPLPASPMNLATADFLEQPELFQLSVVSGAMAMLLHLSEGSARECYAHWSAPEDVVALLAARAASDDAALAEPFPATLLAALDARCRAAD
jgi:hypothetical protein